jgi:hypothetical protein
MLLGRKICFKKQIVMKIKTKSDMLRHYVETSRKKIK